MTVYGELDPIPEHRNYFAFNGKGGDIAQVNIPNMASPNQNIDIEIPHGSRDDVIVPGAKKTTLNIAHESTGKTRSIVNNVSRAPVKKRCSCLDQRKFIRLTTQTSTKLIKIFA